MARYSYVFAALLILETHTDTDMDLTTDIHVRMKDMRVREVTLMCPMVQNIIKKWKRQVVCLTGVQECRCPTRIRRLI